MDLFRRSLDHVINAATVVGAVGVFMMVAHVVLDVLGKFVFATPVPATLSMVSHYYMVIIVFLPQAIAERANGHIAVEVITEHFPDPIQRRVGWFGNLFSFVVFLFLTRQAFLEAGKKLEVNAFMMEQGIRVVIWPSHYLMALGCGLMTITLLARLIGAMRTTN